MNYTQEELRRLIKEGLCKSLQGAIDNIKIHLSKFLGENVFRFFRFDTSMSEILLIYIYVVHKNIGEYRSVLGDPLSLYEDSEPIGSKVDKLIVQDADAFVKLNAIKNWIDKEIQEAENNGNSTSSYEIAQHLAGEVSSLSSLKQEFFKEGD